MQQKSKLSFGPGAASIILIVVILSMSIIGLLSYMMVSNDVSLSDRSARVMEAVYEVNADSERDLALLDAICAKALRETDDETEYLTLVADSLPETMQLDGQVVRWTREAGTQRLECAALIPLPSGEGPVSWQTHKLVVELEEAWN